MERTGYQKANDLHGTGLTALNLQRSWLWWWWWWWWYYIIIHLQALAL